MRLSKWAKENGVSYFTAYRWFRQGKMPCHSERTPSGTIMVYEKPSPEKDKKNSMVVIYARVSSPERKGCLDGQVERCSTFANAMGLQVDRSYKEVASGMNDHRKKLMEMLDSNPTHIIVENKDRLTRFGFNYLDFLLKKQGCQILVLNKEIEDESDLVKDLVSIVTSFCCRLYGLRRGHNKAKAIKKELSKS